MNPDDYTEGEFDSNNPANQEEASIFESNDLQECLDYFRETNDSEPIENAISQNELAKQMVKEDIVEVINLLRTKGLDSTANFLCMTRDKLK